MSEHVLINLAELPSHLISLLLAPLPFEDLVRAAGVCRAWRRVATADQVSLPHLAALLRAPQSAIEVHVSAGKIFAPWSFEWHCKPAEPLAFVDQIASLGLWNSARMLWLFCTGGIDACATLASVCTKCIRVPPVWNLPSYDTRRGRDFRRLFLHSLALGSIPILGLCAALSFVVCARFLPLWFALTVASLPLSYLCKLWLAAFGARDGEMILISVLLTCNTWAAIHFSSVLYWRLLALRTLASLAALVLQWLLPYLPHAPLRSIAILCAFDCVGSAACCDYLFSNQCERRLSGMVRAVCGIRY